MTGLKKMTCIIIAFTLHILPLHKYFFRLNVKERSEGYFDRQRDKSERVRRQRSIVCRPARCTVSDRVTARVSSAGRCVGWSVRPQSSARPKVAEDDRRQSSAELQYSGALRTKRIQYMLSRRARYELSRLLFASAPPSRIVAATDDDQRLSFSLSFSLFLSLSLSFSSSICNIYIDNVAQYFRV